MADVLGAAVGGSRPAAGLDWMPHSHLVGQIGKIVAINKVEDVPIFKAAHVGVVDEWQKVIPALLEECTKVVSG